MKRVWMDAEKLQSGKKRWQMKSNDLSSQYRGGGNSHHYHLGVGVYWAKVSTKVIGASVIFLKPYDADSAIIFSNFID